MLLSKVDFSLFLTLSRRTTMAALHFLEAAIVLNRSKLRIPILDELSEAAIGRVCPPNLPKGSLYPSGHLPAPVWAACFCLLAGSLFRYWAQTTCSQFFTWELSIRPGHKLCTRGPYSIVRHPSYTGLYVLCPGLVLFAFSRHTLFSECISWMSSPAYYGYCAVVMVLVATVNVSFTKRAVKEDEMLKREFGKEWEDWAVKTKYRIFPGIW